MPSPFPVAAQTQSAAAAFLTKVRTHKQDLKAGDFTPPQAFETAGGYGTRLERAHGFLETKRTELGTRASTRDGLPEATRQLSDKARDQFAGVANWADTRGAHTYARGFGGWGLAAREAAVVMAATGQSSAATTVAAGAIGWMSGSAHDAASEDTAKVAPVLDRGATKFVPPPGGATLPENIVGDIVKSFNPALSFGNSASDAMKAGALIATDALVPDSHKALASIAVNALFAAVPYLVGQAANQNAVRNLAATQAEAGFSLSEPLRNAEGGQVGNLVVHKEPKTIGDSEEHARFEMVDRDSNKMHTLALRVPHGAGDEAPSLVYVHKPNEAIPASQAYEGRPAGEDGVPGIPKRTAKYAKRALPLASVATARKPAVTATKTAALGSTIAASATARSLARPAVETWLKTVPTLQNGNGELNSVGQRLADLSMAVVNNLLLGSDLIPKWNTNQRTTGDDVAKDAEALTSGERSLGRDRGAVKQAVDAAVGQTRDVLDGPVAEARDAVVAAWKEHHDHFDQSLIRRPNSPRDERTAELSESGDKLAKTAMRLKESLGENSTAADDLVERTKALSATTGKVLVARRKVAANEALGSPGGDPRPPTSNARKIATAMIPGIGGAVAAGTGQVRRDLPAMTKETFAPYAASEAFSMQLLEQIMRDPGQGDGAVGDPFVVRDNRLTLSDEALDWLLMEARDKDIPVSTEAAGPVWNVEAATDAYLSVLDQDDDEGDEDPRAPRTGPTERPDGLSDPSSEDRASDLDDLELGLRPHGDR